MKNFSCIFHIRRKIIKKLIDFVSVSLRLQLFHFRQFFNSGLSVWISNSESWWFSSKYTRFKIDLAEDVHAEIARLWP